jgi:hypothetical protein
MAPRPRNINRRVAEQGVRLAGAGTRLPPEPITTGEAHGADSPGASILTRQAAGDVSTDPKTADGPVSPVFAHMSERQLQAMIRAGLERRNYKILVIPDMRKSRAGWPDLVFWHPARPGRLWCWEAKTAKGRIRPEQQDVIDHLKTVPGIDARIVRPQDWPALRDDLDVPPPATDGAGRGEEDG